MEISDVIVSLKLKRVNNKIYLAKNILVRISGEKYTEFHLIQSQKFALYDIINLEILYKAVESCVTRVPLNGREAIEFFTAKAQIEKFYNIVWSFQNIDIYPSLRSEMMLLGMEGKFDSSNDEKQNMIFEKTSDYFSQYKKQEIQLCEFFRKEKELVDMD